MATGRTFPELLKLEVYTPVGMKDSSTSAEKAILRSTAVGRFQDQDTMAARPTSMFTLHGT
ncbi:MULTISPECIES: hypothetical protein [unclassified Streptomyces]|uniref:hypothetical protein n=1 Tax=unclassified Streptomyces TaxID=2593676 RepID=UPI0033B40AD5